MESNLLDNIESYVKIIGGLTALILFIIGLFRYNKDQNWKRKEFVSREIKELLDNKTIKNCLLMLDWDSRYIELYPNHTIYEKRYSVIGRVEVTSALIPHGKFKSEYTRDESVIRDSFDFFLDNLSRFDQFIQSGLISPKDIEPYLKYWIDTISDGLPEPLKSTFHHYIISYEYKDVIKLFQRFGRAINPDLTLEEIIKAIDDE